MVSAEGQSGGIALKRVIIVLILDPLLLLVYGLGITPRVSK